MFSLCRPRRCSRPEWHEERPYRGGGNWADVERAAIEDALNACEGNKRAAARMRAVALGPIRGATLAQLWQLIRPRLTCSLPNGHPSRQVIPIRARGANAASAGLWTGAAAWPSRHS